MRFWQDVRRWSDERNLLSQTQFEIEDIEKSYSSTLERTWNGSVDDYHSALAELQSQTAHLHGAIDRIRTKQRLRSASKYEVPIPPKADDSPLWVFSFAAGGFVLSEEGHKYLRREVGIERDLRHKPWVSWMAVVISLTSLFISVINMVWG